ncbi:MAG: hypothetical protein H6757_00375 [Candidatus Omnitrophica bacterium]|nr:hypothetical protein [Candidatus Omnitrophota bacterium]
MRRIHLVTLLVILGFCLQQTLWAAEVTNADITKLMTEMQKMRNDYETQIADLRAELKDLKNQQDQQVSQPVEQAEGKGVDVEYVGRRQGPFEKGGLVADTHSGFGKVSVGGYADIELENFQNNNSTFDQHRFVLNIGAEVGERLRFYSEYEIEHGGPNAAGGDGEAKVEQAWMDFLINDAVNLRAGALLVPFGRYNLYHDSDLQDLTDRPLVARDVIPTTWTESGAGFYGEFNPAIGNFEDLEVAYQFYFINGLSTGFSDTGLGGARGSLESDNNNNKALVGRLVFSPALGQELGISGYAGEASSEGDDIYGIGVDFLSAWGPWEFLGEWAYFSTEESDAGVLGGTGEIPDFFQGAYLQANYHFWFDFLNDTFLGSTFENPTFTLVGRFDWARIGDDFDVATTKDNEEWRWTLGINYRPVESWVLKLEYENNFSRRETLERGNDEGFIASIAMGF